LHIKLELFSNVVDLSKSIGSEWKQCHLPGTLHRVGDHALVFCTGTSHATRVDFTALGNEALQEIYLFVIDMLGAICAKLADPLTPPETAAAR
jgi:hypothetical protein